MSWRSERCVCFFPAVHLLKMWIVWSRYRIDITLDTFKLCRFSDMWANSPFSYEAERERIEKIRAERGRRRPPSRYIYQLKFQHELLPAKIYQVLKFKVSKWSEHWKDPSWKRTEKTPIKVSKYHHPQSDIKSNKWYLSSTTTFKLKEVSRKVRNMFTSEEYC